VTTRERLLVFCCLLFAGGLFVLGINWGLPSRTSDEFLFGGRKPWTGAEILALAPIEEDPSRGADVDADPLTGRDKVLVLNQTDKQRAEIVRRYRLFTYQPDEYNTLKSLSGMNPGQFQLDPRMYQYGGLWIYPVGALLKVASAVGFVDLSHGADKAFYLDNPDAFGRFYIVARLYSAAWGVIGAWAVYMLARKLTGRSTPAAAASACWAMMPVVVNMAHEAKPHLAGLSLMLLAILAASRYVETGKRRWWVSCAIACGAATGMVISSLVIFVLLPMILILRPLERPARLRLAAKFVGIGLLVYAASNPYVFINLVRNPGVLRSNLGTSTAMYHASAAAGIWLNGGTLMLEAATIAVVLFGVIGVLHVIESSISQRRLNFYWPGCPAVHLLWLLVAAGLLVAVQFFVLAAGKSGEYGRFALLPATVLCVLAVTSFWTFLPPARVAFLSTLLVCTAWFGTNYLAHFNADVDPLTSPRTLVAEALRGLTRTPAKKLAIVAEPAPYSMPPVDLWYWELQLLPRDTDPGMAARAAGSDVVVRPVDQLPDTVPAEFRRLERPLADPLLANPARISWAAKPFEILAAERLPASAVDDSAEPAATEPSQTRPAP
jgi:hypothetical protein